MKETIGIVLTKRTKNSIEGYLATQKVGVMLNEDGLLQVKPEIIREFFELKISKKKLLIVESGGTIYTAKKIGEELKKIGFKNIILLFNEEEIPI